MGPTFDISPEGIASDAVMVWELDLSNCKSVTAFAEKAKKLKTLDIAILNAGLNKISEDFCSTGYEETIQVNYLSTMLLAILLLPVVEERKTGPEPGRIIVVSSDVASWAILKERSADPLLPQFKERMAPWGSQDRYGTSKLLGQLFLSELASRIPSSIVTVSCANCGLCKGSNLSRQFTGGMQQVLRVMHYVLGRECQVGARTFVHGFTTIGQDAHGQYLEDAKIQPMAPLIYEPEGRHIARRLYEEILEQLSFAGAREILEQHSKKGQ